MPGPLRRNPHHRPRHAGTPYSALFSASPESGDLIGYAFKNDSAAGKANPTSDLKESVMVAMPGFMGPFESAAVKQKAAMTKSVYTYRNGQVLKNGKPVQ